jgi:lipoprotein signal peptidase
MRIAQQLYEGVEIKGNGTVGIITYLRTDSTRISEEADANARNYIAETYGQQYTSKAGKKDDSGKKIQDAHEAIRPTDVTRTPAMIKESLTRDQFRLYQLIWKRFVASRMNAAKYETTSIKIGAKEYRFTVAASKMIFEGFRAVYTESDEEKEDNNVLARSIDKNSKLIKDIFELAYVENRGAAFGMMQNKQVFFILTTVLVVGLILWIFHTMPMEKKFIPARITLVFIIAGAVGNFIDRVMQGFVVDFLYFKLINFPVFNVADIYVTCAVFVLAYLLLIFYKEEDIDRILKMGRK